MFPSFDGNKHSENGLPPLTSDPEAPEVVRNRREGVALIDNPEGMGNFLFVETRKCLVTNPGLTVGVDTDRWLDSELLIGKLVQSGYWRRQRKKSGLLVIARNAEG